MKSSEVDPNDLQIDPSNKRWTLPRSWGVWEIATHVSTQRYRKGNYPIREEELIKDYGAVKLIALYLDEESAKCHAKELNNGY